MATSVASDEVAEDYKNSLDDLTLNSRYEISNLTVIAKENVDHALAISRVIENHIRNAPPTRKLPALYVLDSVVKNVGTPYTLFFGRNLYQTYMNAYSLVEGPIRKKLEEMLKTWKEPVPGSLDSSPVFLPEITRPIENALIKARTAAIQLQQQQAKGLQSRVATGWRGNSTPPPPSVVPMARSVQAPAPGPMAQPQGLPPAQAFSHRQVAPQPVPAELMHMSGLPSNGSQPAGYPQHPTPPQIYSPYQPPDAYAPPPEGLDVLNNDLIVLLSSAQADADGNPYDQSLQQRLHALVDLQRILHTQNLSPDQLKLIRNQVAQLSAASPPVRPPSPSTRYSPPPAAPAQDSVPPAPMTVQPSVQSLLPPGALAALLASVSSGQAQKPPTPQPALPLVPPSIAVGPSPSAPPPLPNAAPQQPDGSSLIASLRAAGLLQPAPPARTAMTTPSTTTAPALAMPAIIKPPLLPCPPHMRHPLPAMPVRVGQARHPFVEIPNDVQLTSASIKVPRPHLISLLYEAQPNQCVTCGRRFLATDDGRKKKARHLDWHFKVNLRMAEAIKRAQHRSWYVDEVEWIKFRDMDDADEGASTADGMVASGAPNDGSSAANAKPKEQWVPVPNEPALATGACPICQEQFETVWHDDAQEWVWMDAVMVKGRVYHASCHAEASKDGTSTPTLSHLTADAPILGKRKAEETDSMLLRSRFKREEP